MARYNYKYCVDMIPAYYMGDAFKDHNGFEFEGTADMDGDIYLAAADVIRDARSLLQWILKHPSKRLGDYPHLLAKARQIAGDPL